MPNFSTINVQRFFEVNRLSYGPVIWSNQRRKLQSDNRASVDSLCSSNEYNAKKVKLVNHNENRWLQFTNETVIYQYT